MAAKTTWHRQGTKLRRQCQPLCVYRTLSIPYGTVVSAVLPQINVPPQSIAALL